MSVSPHSRVAILVTRLATALALLVALTPVTIFAVAAYLRAAAMLDANLQLQAIAVENVIQLQPEHWEMNPARLTAGFERYVIPGERFRIVNLDGQVVVDIGRQPTWPRLVRSRPVHDFGRPVGRVEAATSIVGVASFGLALFVFSLALAWLIWGPLRRLPLAALASAEAEVRRRDQYQRAVLDNLPFITWLKDTDGRYLAVNRMFAESIGEINADALVGKTDLDIFPRAEAERFRADDRVLLATRQNTSVEEELLVFGVRCWHETFKALVYGDDSRILATVGFTRDISARKQADAELERYRHQLEAVVAERTADLRQAHQELLATHVAMDRVGIGIRRVDNATHRVVYANRFAAEMLGYTVDEMVGAHISDLDPQVALPELNDLLRRQGRAQFETVSRTRDGRLIPVDVALHYTAACAEAPAHTIAFVTDITQRRIAEASLRRLSQAVEQSLAGIVIFDAQRVIQYVNPAFINTSGYAASALIGRTADCMNTSTHGAQFNDELWRTVSAGKVWLGELQSRRANGDRYWSQVSVSPILEQAAGRHEVLGYVAIMDDISERKETLRQLQESEERFRQAFVHAPFGIAVVAIDGQVREANMALCHMLGYADGEINGRALAQLIADQPSAKPWDPLGALLDGASSSLAQEMLGVRRDGAQLPVISTVSLVRDANAQPLNFIVQIEDISERKQVQLKDLASGILAAQERERARLSHELHDEIGQSLTALKIALKRAQQNAADPLRIDTCLRDGQQLLEQLMDEVRSIAHRLRPSELDQLGLAAALRSHLDKTIRPLGQKVTLLENIGEARLPASLELCCFRVVQEALTNALRHARAAQLEVSLALDGAQLCVAVKDNGVGFDLERHYSAHERHASLGLIGMRERVAANGGQLLIRSFPGEGTEVVATFAAADSCREAQ